MAKKTKKKNEFRTKNMKDGKGHPAYIFAQQGDEYIYLGLTHADITKGVKNIPLEDNPDPEDSRKSFVRPRSERKNKSSFGKKLKGWFFSKRDKEKIDKLIKK